MATRRSVTPVADDVRIDQPSAELPLAARSRLEPNLGGLRG
jgi:hypothetical protein